MSGRPWGTTPEPAYRLISTILHIPAGAGSGEGRSPHCAAQHMEPRLVMEAFSLGSHGRDGSVGGERRMSTAANPCRRNFDTVLRSARRLRPLDYTLCGHRVIAAAGRLTDSVAIRAL